MAALTTGSSARKSTAEQANTIWATGRRKTAVARVRLNRGDGKVVVNGRALEDYFGRETSRMIVQQPFDVTNSHGQFAINVNIKGGGLSAQAVAIRHGITRALMAANAELRGPLKKAGFVTRDPRKVERKKYGRHKARKRPQYSKR
jgi:small subunit ribosomal protein S9